MSVIEKLDSVLAGFVDADALTGPDGWAAREDAAWEAGAFLRDHGPAIRQDMIDARRYQALRAENEKLRAALRKIADWHGDFGAFPETNNAWRAMVVVTAREAVPELDAAIDARLASDSEGGE